MVEHLYETRVAAAERLLAFFVIFHHAVKPLSKLWGLSFDMDRSESRLRVASTPAPVPFVESLEQEPPWQPRLITIQNALRKKLQKHKDGRAEMQCVPKASSKESASDDA